MAKEKDCYRLNYEMVLCAFNDNPFPALKQVARYLHKDVRQLQNDHAFMKLTRASGGRTHMSLPNLAHYMTGGDR